MAEFELDGITFSQEIGKPHDRGVSSGDKFVLVKTDTMLEFYDQLKFHAPRHIMEVGMYEGGSMVYFDKLYKPKTLVGLDSRRAPIDALEEYKSDKSHINTYYGRYQEKPGTLMAARQNFPEGIDLVVDDASHLYNLTKATFSMLFPMVRAGGHYVIEDWSWAHKPAYQGRDAVWGKQPALTNLVFELIMLASQTGVVENIQVTSELVSVRKGPGVFRPDMLDFSNCLRGKQLTQI